MRGDVRSPKTTIIKQSSQKMNALEKTVAILLAVSQHSSFLLVGACISMPFCAHKAYRHALVLWQNFLPFFLEHCFNFPTSILQTFADPSVSGRNATNKWLSAVIRIVLLLVKRNGPSTDPWTWLSPIQIKVSSPSTQQPCRWPSTISSWGSALSQTFLRENLCVYVNDFITLFFQGCRNQNIPLNVYSLFVSSTQDTIANFKWLRDWMFQAVLHSGSLNMATLYKLPGHK